MRMIRHPAALQPQQPATASRADLFNSFHSVRYCRNEDGGYSQTSESPCTLSKRRLKPSSIVNLTLYLTLCVVSLESQSSHVAEGLVD